MRSERNPRPFQAAADGGFNEEQIEETYTVDNGIVTQKYTAVSCPNVSGTILNTCTITDGNMFTDGVGGTAAPTPWLPTTLPSTVATIGCFSMDFAPPLKIGRKDVAPSDDRGEESFVQ